MRGPRRGTPDRRRRVRRVRNPLCWFPFLVLALAVGDDPADLAWRWRRGRRRPAASRGPAPGRRSPRPRRRRRDRPGHAPPWWPPCGASSAMKTNATARQLRALVGFVVEEPRGPARQVPPALHGDRHVGQRMRNTLQRRDRHPERVAGLGELRGDGHGLLDQADQRGGRQQPPFIQRQIDISRAPRRRCPAPCGCRRCVMSTHAIGSRPMLSTLAGRVSNVSRTTSSPSRTHDVIGDRTGRRSAGPGPRRRAAGPARRSAPRLTIGRQLGAPSRGQQPGRADVVDPRHRRQRPADLLGHQRQIHQRRAVAARRTRAAPSWLRPWRTTVPRGSCRSRSPRPPARSRSEQCVLKNCR